MPVLELESKVDSAHVSEPTWFRGKRYVCGRNHYIMVIWYEDGVRFNHYEHRLVWEFYHGPIPPGYVVHHIDGDTQNNVIGNLRCMPKPEHRSGHEPEQGQKVSATCRRKLLAMARDRLPDIDRLLRLGLSVEQAAHNLRISKRRAYRIIRICGYEIQTYHILTPGPGYEMQTWMPGEHLIDLPSAHEEAAQANRILGIRRANKKRSLPDGSRKICSACHTNPVEAKGLCGPCYQRNYHAQHHNTRSAGGAT